MWTNLWAILDDISGNSSMGNSNLGFGLFGNKFKSFNNTSGRGFEKEPADTEFNSQKDIIYWLYLFWLLQKTQPKIA